MSGLRLKQLAYESDHWKRSLGYMAEANIHNKNSISRLLKENLNEASLASIERFYNQFLAEDNVISLLRHDIAELDLLLTNMIFEDGSVPDEVYNKIKKLRITSLNAEERFNNLKKEFTGFLRDNIFYS